MFIDHDRPKRLRSVRSAMLAAQPTLCPDLIDMALLTERDKCSSLIGFASKVVKRLILGFAARCEDVTPPFRDEPKSVRAMPSIPDFHRINPQV